MVSRQVFAECWQLLERRWGEQTAEKRNDFYDWIHRRLTDEQCRFAATDLHATSEFFPKPLDFIDHAPRLEMPRLPEPDRYAPHACNGCGREIIGPAKRCFRCHLADAGLKGPDADLYERAVMRPAPPRRE